MKQLIIIRYPEHMLMHDQINEPDPIDAITASLKDVENYQFIVLPDRNAETITFEYPLNFLTMSKSLKLTDLQQHGLALTQKDAQELLPHISKISQHGSDGLNEVEFEKGSMHTAESQKQHNSAGQANSVKASTGFTPVSGDNLPPEPIKQKKLTKADFTKKPELTADGYKVGDLYPRTVTPAPELDNENSETIKFTVTQEYLDDPANAQLVADGVVVGDEIDIPNPDYIAE